MKRLSFFAKGNRSGKILHIETDGCIVNIQVGLHDRDGRQVTSVRVLPDNYDERGGRWVLDGSRVVQLLEGETALAPDPGTEILVPLTRAERLLLLASEYNDPEGWQTIGAKIKAAEAGKPEAWKEYQAG